MDEAWLANASEKILFSTTVDCAWSNWTEWSACNQTCNGGWHYRTRSSSPALYGGKICTGPSRQDEICNPQPCPGKKFHFTCMQRFIIIRPAIISVDGYWKAWSEWSACSVTCNSGIQTSTRQCVPPLYGGKDCVGNGVQTRPCELVAKCPSKTFIYQQHKEDIFICVLSCQLTVSGLTGETGHDALSLVMEELKHEVASSWSLLSTEAKLV